MRNSRILVATFGLVSSLFVFGCGSKDTPAAASCPTFDYSSYTAPKKPGLTLTKDVMPIFQTNCALTQSCHGNTAAAMAKQAPALGSMGPMMTDTAGIAAVHTALVGAQSKQAPALQLVMASDPDKSYLMKKIEGVNNCSDLTCMKIPGQLKDGCGDVMPQPPTGVPLSDDDKETVRSWIKGGATL